MADKNLKVHFMSNNTEWATPKSLFDKLNSEYHFTLDVCATPENTKCEKFFTVEDDGLKQSWIEFDWSKQTFKNPLPVVVKEIIFCNPPYGRALKDWVEKCYNEHAEHGITVVILIPARTDTQAWHDWIFPHAARVRFIKSRVKFELDGIKRNSPSFPSVIIEFSNKKYADRLQTFYL